MYLRGNSKRAAATSGRHKDGYSAFHKSRDEDARDMAAEYGRDVKSEEAQRRRMEERAEKARRAYETRRANAGQGRSVRGEKVR